MVINRYQVKSPTEIVTTTLGIPEDYKQQCIQEAYKIGDKQGQKTNVKAIMSSWDVGEETNVYDLLSTNIFHIIEEMLPIYEGNKFEMSDMWFAIYKEGHYTTKHRHSPAYMSFVYYLKASGSASPLVFDGCEFQIQPHDDLLVVFPSHLLHSVPKHKGEDRICVAGNLSIVPGGDCSTQ